MRIATMSGGGRLPAGLSGVAVAETSLSEVDGKRGVYHYRGHDPVELAAGGTLEEAWYLLQRGTLPSTEELERFVARTAAARAIPDPLRRMLPEVAATAPPGSMQALRSAVSIAGSVLGCRPWLEQDPADTQEQVIALSALVPVLAAALYRSSLGLEVVDPDDRLGHAANLLHMLEGATPEGERVEGLERYLVLAAEHGFNNSAFAARVVVSSGTDVASGVVAAIGSLAGPLHGGAVGRVPSMLDAIGSVDRVEPFVAGALERGERLMGFGHPVYETVDPRSESLRSYVRRFGGPRVELAEAFEQVAVRLLNERKGDRRREANVDFYAGIALEIAGVPEALYEATFAAARVIGWGAHILEQISANRIFRPDARYVGVTP